MAAEVDDVVVSGSGEEAVDYMFGTGAYDGRDANVTPEFVLLDVNLPKLDGHQVLDKLRGDERPPRAPTPTVPPTAVPLDVNRPRLDGHQVLEKLRGDERTHLVPVILFSSSSEHKDVVKGYELGANSYVTKPANFDKFSEAMQYLGWYWLNFNESP